MNPARKRRIRLVVALSAAVLLASALIYTSFSASSEAVTPSRLAAGAATGRAYQLTGKVVMGSVQDIPGGKTFRVQDRNGSASIPVRYVGAVPDPFRDGREVIITVRKQGSIFVGERDSLVTKCPSKFVEDADIREISAVRRINDGYANGYGNSKWAGEVLLREAHDLCGLPVAVFRCDMILADTTYAGQLNLPDMFTRMMLSLVATGIAPGSFYELDAEDNRQRSHYDGLPVEFIADAVSTLGAQSLDAATGYQTFHVMNPYDDGIGLDQYVDWLSEAGYSIDRIADYRDWLQRFETTLRALPDRQRQYSLLPLLHNYQKPEKPMRGSMAPTDRFRAAVQDAKIGPDKDIPHVSAPMIVKYITDLQLLGLL